MKSILLNGIRQMQFKEVPEPKITSNNDVLIRITRVGVCGSDIHYYKSGKIGN